MKIELDLTRGELVYVRHALKQYLGTRDMRLTERTQAVGKAHDQMVDYLTGGALDEN